MTSPASVPPSQVPGASSGNGQYIALAAVLLLAMGGLLFWKLRGSSSDTPAAVPSATASAPTVTRPAMDAPPPPPDDPAAPEPSASAAKKVATPGSNGGFGCSAAQCGTPAPAMRGELQSRAANARGCYERALRNNASLQGRVVVAVRVDSQGAVCSASVAQDTVGGDVASCILPMFKSGRFSPPTGGCADATVPLNFQPKNK